ncbi:MAG: hypothetical protein LBQ63_00355 [Deltaproteobacteria bacterium]|jgi:hypothetical protein|nr:hypothetical protein [Deltaproteobacteria bacterium]
MPGPLSFLLLVLFSLLLLPEAFFSPFARAWGKQPSSPASSENGGSAEDKFSRMDADADGRVEREEFFALYPQMREAAFVAIDSSGDGSLSLLEWLEFSDGHAVDMARSLPEARKGDAPEKAPADGGRKQAAPDLFKLAPRGGK